MTVRRPTNPKWRRCWPSIVRWPPATTRRRASSPPRSCSRYTNASVFWRRSGPEALRSSFELPKQFGRFSIVRELGRGGFGVVFLAEDLVLGRQVALKVPRPEVLVTPEVRRRFLREAEAASRLDHPHIVPVYEVGEEGPICYIASAYCEGPTLAQWLRLQTASVPIRVACPAGGGPGRGGRARPRAGHSSPRSQTGQHLAPATRRRRSATERLSDELGFIPRICDFGLAKLLDQVSQETRSGVPIGSPAYMAPNRLPGGFASTARRRMFTPWA